MALVGFREWVFSQDSGALAGFAAATEFTFGSIVQRTMTWPGSVRFHYGHPDCWNKLWVMTRGGVSKATRAFHISEDVFAGYNHVQRSGNVKFKVWGRALRWLRLGSCTLALGGRPCGCGCAALRAAARAAVMPAAHPAGPLQEYISVGKGRDMGFDSINSFESKVGVEG